MKHYLYNMVTSIRNGQISKKTSITFKYKTVFPSILEILWIEGFISGYKIIIENNEKKIRIFLKYVNGHPVINSIRFIAKPGHKVYFSAKQIWKLNSTKICLIISTTQGIKSIVECKQLNIGGKPLFVIS